MLNIKKGVLNFSTNLPENFLILRRILLHIIIKVHRYLCKVPVFLVRFE